MSLCKLWTYRSSIITISCIYTLQDMDLNQELHQSVTDVRTDKGNTICHVHIRKWDIKIPYPGRWPQSPKTKSCGEPCSHNTALQRLSDVYVEWRVLHEKCKLIIAWNIFCNTCYMKKSNSKSIIINTNIVKFLYTCTFHVYRTQNSFQNIGCTCISIHL